MKRLSPKFPLDKFQLVFTRILESLFMDRMEQNEDIFARYMNDRDFQQLVGNWLTDQVYTRLRKPGEPVVYKVAQAAKQPKGATPQ